MLCGLSPRISIVQARVHYAVQVEPEYKRIPAPILFLRTGIVINTPTKINKHFRTAGSPHKRYLFSKSITNSR